MAIDIIVIRCSGTNAGEDIVDPMIVNVSVALERGRHEINEKSGTRQTTLQTKYRNNVRLGDIAEVHDSLQGSIWRGKISAISHKAANAGATLITDLTINRPREGGCP